MSIVVFVEHKNGAARRASLEALGAAHATGQPVIAIAVGADAAAVAATLGNHGATKVHALSGDFNAAGTAQDVAKIATDEGAKACIAAASTAGKDLMPRVAMRLDSVPFTECTAFRLEGDAYESERPWLAGKCTATVRSSGPIFCATLRPNVFPVAETGGTAEVAEGAGTVDDRVKVTGITAKEGGALDVKEAPIVVSGGRGLKEAEHFKLVEDLAAAFGGNAAVGASRAVVDAGWRSHGEQVGQTGKTVAPQLYIAIGISGAIQHLAGMRTSKVIVAINKDADAPIFKVADYGIVGDAFEVVPALTEAIKGIVSAR